MRTITLTLLAALAVACSGGADDDDTDETANPFECEPSDHEGTYVMHLEQRDGDCGELPDRIGGLGDLADDPEGNCDSGEYWTDGDCRLEVTFTCEDTAERGTYEETLVLNQRDEAGDRFTGILSTVAWDTNGAEVCRGTYDVSATRP